MQVQELAILDARRRTVDILVCAVHTGIPGQPWALVRASPFITCTCSRNALSDTFNMLP